MGEDATPPPASPPPAAASDAAPSAAEAAPADGAVTPPEAAPEVGERAPGGDAIRAGLAAFATVHEAHVALHGDLWGALADPAAGVTMAEATLPSDHGDASLTVDWRSGDAVRRVEEEADSPLSQPIYAPVRALVTAIARGDPTASCADARCVRGLPGGGEHLFRFALAPGGQLRLLGVLRVEDPRVTAEAATLARVRAIFEAAVDGHLPSDWPR